eukprot:SAG31_NODE_7049_length_1803_cov_390.134977_1_plen_61_part_00
MLVLPKSEKKRRQQVETETTADLEGIVSFARDNGDEEGGWHLGTSSFNNKFEFCVYCMQN